MSFEIPEEYLDGFVQISKLKKEEVEELSSILLNLDIGKGPNTILSKAAEAVKKSEEEVKSIFTSLISALQNVYDNRVEKSELIPLLVASFKEVFPQTKSQIISALGDNLTKLIESDRRILLTRKAFNLQNDFEKVYLESRIITDIRLVYDVESPINEKNAEYAVISHQLKLTYLKDLNRTQVYFALDRDELHLLSEQIQRALEKDNQIRENCYTTGISIIDFDSLD